LDTIAKKSKRVSFDQFDHKDDQIVSINWGSIRQTFLNVAKKVANFVVAVLPDAKYRHWNEHESVDDVATPVSTGMLYYLPEHFTGPYTAVGEVDPLIANLANTHMSYSVPTDPDRQQLEQLAFAREVDNEIKASDSHINHARMI
jgi:hypothetical protein